jgi:type IV pilus assembly protein PilX
MLRHSFARRPRGVTLIVVLMILLVVTVIGIGAVQISLSSERSARFDRDQQVARQAAEAALMDAEFDIRGPNTSGNSRVSRFVPENLMDFAAGCNTGSTLRGMCLPNETGKPVWFTVDFLATSNQKTVEFGEFTGRSFDAGTLGVQPAHAPRYIIEMLDDPTGPGSKKMGEPKKIIYRVTAMGFGPREGTQVVLQTVFRKE